MHPLASHLKPVGKKSLPASEAASTGPFIFSSLRQNAKEVKKTKSKTKRPLVLHVHGVCQRNENLSNVWGVYKCSSANNFATSKLQRNIRSLDTLGELSSTLTCYEMRMHVHFNGIAFVSSNCQIITLLLNFLCRYNMGLWRPWASLTGCLQSHAI